MKVAPFDNDGFKLDHPRGTVSFNYLLMGGEPEKLENFRYILGRQEADFQMPRHRHTFEQIRLPLVGDMNLGDQGILHEGEIGYFPEGQTYGPQDDPLDAYGAKPGERLQLVLQFGGASGLGMAGARGRGPQAQQEEGDRIQRERRQVRFPRPRYKNVIIMDPRHFNWLPLAGAPGVERKYFGSFSERGFWIEFTKVAAGTQWDSTTEAGRRLIVLLSGTARVDNTPLGRWAAIQVEEGERLQVDAAEETVLYIVGLPKIEVPEAAGDSFDIDVSDGGIQFEKRPQTV